MEKCIEAIKEWHKGQVDKLGNPYWEHPVRVMKIAKKITADSVPELPVIALFHDVLEDVENGLEKMYELLRSESGQFRVNVIGSVELLTKPKWRSYSEYVSDIFESENYWAKIVKKADLIDHLTLLDRISDETELRRLLKKYSSVIQFVNV